MVKPIRVVLAALFLTVAAAGSARAEATYLLSLQGTDQHYYPPCRLPGEPTRPCDVTVDLSWTGTLDIVIDASADGVYADADVLSFDFRTSAGSLVLPYFPGGGSVTVAGGRVTSVDLLYLPGEEVGYWGFGGLEATYSRYFDSPHVGADFATGRLTAVSEPGTTTLMILALACIGAVTTRSRRKMP